MSDSGLKDAVHRAAAKDPDAWEWLYRRAHGRLFSYARRRLRSDQAADEAVSETMTRALEKIGGFEWRGVGFDGWLYGILRNVVHELRRSGQRGDPTHEAEEAPAEPDVDPASITERRHRSRALRAAFARLSEEDRELLELRVVGGLGSDEAGRALGKSAGAVRMAQARALERLRAQLEAIERV